FFMLGTKGADEGHILENIVFLELKRRGYELYVGKIDDMEIDFVAIKDGKTNYVQVSMTVRDEQTLSRELKPLLSVKDSFSKILITMDNAPVIYHDGIKQLFALDFLNGAEL
ncbi:MAG: ATPase, partial [Treponemataceae bacterium]|nr:ATPase [Treponemataceae bacterium]